MIKINKGIFILKLFVFIILHMCYFNKQHRNKEGKEEVM